MDRLEIFEKWLNTSEGKMALAAGEHTQEYTREQGLRLAFILGTENPPEFRVIEDS